jgi:hypothetical protein
MRILILGISSLEYDLVEEFDLKNLKQKEYGKIEIPLNGLLVDPSPILIWTSFITGKKPGSFGYDNTVVYRKPLKPLLNMYYKTRMKKEYEDVSERDIDKKTTDYLCKKLLKYHLARLPSKNDIDCPTLFDQPGRIHMDVPVIYKIFDYNEKAKQALEQPEKKTCCEQEWRTEFERQRQQVFDSLTGKWDLSMIHFYLLDGIQHIYFDDKLKIRTYYSYVDGFIQDLKQKLPKDVLLMIISDNGKKNGLQTNHGFYSISKRLGLKQKKMTEFKDIIEKILLEDINQIFLGG